MMWWVGLCLVVAIWAYYVSSAARRPELHYLATAEHQRLLQQIPQLQQRFWVTPWLFNGYLQLLWLGLRKRFAAPLQYDRSEPMVMADGGTTALHWLDRGVSDDTPIIIVLHTITGSAHSMRGLMQDLQQQTGWRMVLCERRGHGELALTSAKFNTMGDVEDLVEHVAAIEAQFPSAPLYMMGVSAGTGLLTRYLVQQGQNTPVKAAFSYCPGYDIEVAFSRAAPWLSKKMARKLIQQFVTPNETVLLNHATALEAPDDYHALASAQSLQQFQERLYRFSGYDSLADYMAHCNPVNGMEHIAIPVMVLNAEDDPICAADNVRDFQAMLSQLPEVMLVITRRGTHCAHFSGIWPKPWAHQLAGRYFLACQQASGSD